MHISEEIEEVMNNILIFLLLGLAALTTAEKKNWDKIMKQAKQNAQNIDEEDECAGKDVSTLCEDLVQFTPQLCSNDLAVEKCTEQCGEGKTAPGMKFIKIVKAQAHNSFISKPPIKCINFNKTYF